MISRILFFLALCVFSFTVSSCGDDVECTDLNALNSFFNTTIVPLNEAISTYNATLDEQSCNDLQDAYNEFIDDLESYNSCAEEFNFSTEWQTYINDAQADRNLLNCPS